MNRLFSKIALKFISLIRNIAMIIPLTIITNLAGFAIMGAIVYDLYSNVYCLSSFIPIISVAVSLAIATTFTLTLLGFKPEKTKLEIIALIFLIISSSTMSISTVFLQKNKDNEIRQISDSLLDSWKKERSDLLAQNSKAWNDYNELETDRPSGAKARRQENKLVTVNRIAKLDTLIYNRETFLANVGGELNQSLTEFSNKKFATVFFFMLGLISPIVLSLACPIVTKLYPHFDVNWLAVTKSDLISHVSVTFQSQTTREQSRVTSRNVDREILSITAVEYVLSVTKEYNRKVISSHAAKLIGREPFDPSFVSHVKSGKYKDKIKAHPIEANKALLYVKSQSKNLSA